MKLKPIQNVKPIVKKSYASQLVCRVCEAEDSIIAHYSERAFGVASVVNRDGELENYELSDSDDFDLSEFECRECGETSTDLDSLILSEEELERGEEEDD